MGTGYFQDLQNKVAALLRSRLIDLNEKILVKGGWEWAAESIVAREKDYREPEISQYMLAKTHLDSLEDYDENLLENLLELLRDEADLPASLLPEEHPIEAAISRLMRRYLQFKEAREAVRKFLKNAETTGSLQPGFLSQLQELFTDLEILTGLLERDSSGPYHLLTSIRAHIARIGDQAVADELLLAKLQSLAQISEAAIRDLGHLESDDDTSNENEDGRNRQKPPERIELPPAVLSEIARRMETLVFIDDLHRESYRDAAGGVMLAAIRATDTGSRSDWLKKLQSLAGYTDYGLWRLGRSFLGAPSLPEFPTFLNQKDEGPSPDEVRIQNLYDSTELVMEIELARLLKDPDARNERTTTGQQVVRFRYKMETLGSNDLREVEALARLYGLDPNAPPADSALRLAVKNTLLAKARSDAAVMSYEEGQQLIRDAEAKGLAALSLMTLEDVITTAREIGVDEEITEWIDVSPVLKKHGITPYDRRAPLSDDPCILEREELRLGLLKKIRGLDKEISDGGGWLIPDENGEIPREDPREPWITRYYDTLRLLHSLPQMNCDEVIDHLLILSHENRGKSGYDRVRMIVDSMGKLYSQLISIGSDNTWELSNEEVDGLIRALISEEKRLAHFVQAPTEMLVPDITAIADILRKNTTTLVERVQRLSEDDRVRYTERGKDNAIFTLREQGTNLIATLDYTAAIAEEKLRKQSTQSEDIIAISGAENIPVKQAPFDQAPYLRLRIQRAAEQFFARIEKMLVHLSAEEQEQLSGSWLKELKEFMGAIESLESDQLAEEAVRWGVDPNSRPEGPELRAGIQQALGQLNERLVKAAEGGDVMAEYEMISLNRVRESLWDLPLSEIIAQVKTLGFSL